MERVNLQDLRAVGELTLKWLKLLRLDSREATQSREELGSTFNRTRQHSDLPQIIDSEHCRRNPLW
jgi:hypothetical protein